MPQWKLWSKFSKKTKKKNFRTIVITKRSIFIVNHLSRLLVWLKLGLQVPKNPRHCKRHNWGPTQFKPLPQYSHNSAPFLDYPSWTQLQVLSQAFPHVDIKWLYRGIFYDCASGFCSTISLNRGSVRYILLSKFGSSWRKSFLIPRTLLNRDSLNQALNRGSTVKQVSEFSTLSNEFEVASTLTKRTNVATFHRIQPYHTQTLQKGQYLTECKKNKAVLFYVSPALFWF